MRPESAPSRPRWIVWHAALAGFAAPTLVLFLATGALYTFGWKGEYATERFELAADGLDLAAPALGPLEARARAELSARGIAEPSGEARIRRAGTSWEFEWTGAARDVLLAPNAAGGVTLQHKVTRPWRRLVQLHKAKGGGPFKLLAGAVAAAMTLVLATGYAVGWSVPRYRRATLTATVVGVVALLAAALAS